MQGIGGMKKSNNITRLERRVLHVHLQALGAVGGTRAAAAAARGGTQQVARQRLNGWCSAVVADGVGQQ
jgi:hypothetical protein